jgi:D-alanyl-D-alanine carboxypeptidase
MDSTPRPLVRYAGYLGVLILTVLAVYGVLSFVKSNPALQAEITNLRSTVTAREVEIAKYTSELEAARQALTQSEERNDELKAELDDERDRNDDFEDQINDLSGTVGDLDKLSKIDAELLQKYSKVYFLNEHYQPPRVRSIDDDFIFKKAEPEYVHAQVLPFLEDLLEDAQDDGIDLLVLSGYRSFDEQRSLKGAYTVSYGSGANAFSADQGYSEHQLGTTLDFTTPALNGALTGFQNTEAYAWLLKHAYRYGFVLSYPENNQYYVYEPWHWRFVGEDLADYLHDQNKSFYDVDQRKINEYLISIFD